MCDFSIYFIHSTDIFDRLLNEIPLFSAYFGRNIYSFLNSY